ncbi:5505_t:CDS:1, partial [Racocetra fulgida]
YEANITVNESDLEEELDYFQIPSNINYLDYDLAHKKAAKFLSQFINLIESVIFENLCILERYIRIGFYKNEWHRKRTCTNFELLNDSTKKEHARFENFGYRILNALEKQIIAYLISVLPGALVELETKLDHYLIK